MIMIHNKIRKLIYESCTGKICILIISTLVLISYKNSVRLCYNLFAINKPFIQIQLMARFVNHIKGVIIFPFRNS